MANAIVISVPAKGKDCFIAMPFSKEEEFETLFNLIIKATGGRTWLRTDMDPKVDFVRDITNNLLSANLIVCVCSPEHDSKKPNSNVMYELGIAHALGKPTIILTNNIDTLPSDIAAKYAIDYGDYDITNSSGQTALRYHIGNIIETTIHRSKDNLIDIDWEPLGIQLASAKYKMCLRPDFWSNFKTILSFEDMIQTNFQPIDTELSQLRKITEDIVIYARNDTKSIMDFKTTWSSYCNYCHETKNGFFSSYQSKINENDRSFTDLKTQAIKEEVKEANKYIEDAEKSYEYIKAGLTEFQSLHGQLQKNVGDDPAICLRDLNKGSQLIAPLAQLVVQTRSFLVQSHNLISNMIKII